MVALAPSAARTHSHKKSALEVVHPWTPAPTKEAVENVAVYLTVKNAGASAERLVGAECPLAEKVELVDLQSVAGMTLPTTVAALAVPAHGQLVLGPAGPRLLLHKLAKRLHAYDSFPVTLVFEKAGRMPVEVMVEEEEAGEDGAKHKH